MYRFDSRRLSFLDTYTRRFEAPGTYTYAIADIAGHQDLRIVVSESPGDEPRQRRIAVVFDGETRRFSAEPEQIEIAAGDTVQWHSPGRAQARFFVRGARDDDQEAFDSRALDDASIYTHAFIQPGVYEFGSAGEDGEVGAARGTIQVAETPRVGWRKQVEKPAVVRIGADGIEPKRLEVPAGGTVIFLAAKGPVTASLVRYGRASVTAESRARRRSRFARRARL
jgi:plastocyanin